MSSSPPARRFVSRPLFDRRSAMPPSTLLRSIACLALALLTACPSDPPDDCASDPARCLPDAGDAGEDSPTDAGDAGELSPAERDAGPGSGPDAGPPPPSCSEEDVAAWTAAHRRIDLPRVLAACAADPRCAEPPCSFEQCLRERAGVTACEACTSREVACVLGECRTACAPSSPSDRCRGCICASGCFDAFETCAGHATSLCEACDPDAATCPPFVLSPALIMTIPH